MLTAPTTLQQHLQAWHAALIASDWPGPSRDEPPVEAYSTTHHTPFEIVADWPEPVRH